MTGTPPYPLAPYDWSQLPSRRALIEQIEAMPISADAKVLLSRLAATTAEVGGRVLEIGRRIVAFAIEAAKMFPNTLFGVIVGAAMTVIIASAAVVGGLLAPLLGPLLIAFGLGAGALLDVKDGALRARIARLEDDVRAATA